MAIEAVQAFSKYIQNVCGLVALPFLLEAFGGEPSPLLQSPAMQLAARAFLLFFNHVVVAKQQGRLSWPVAVRYVNSGPALQAQATALLKCRQQTEFASGFDGFFDCMEQILTSDTPMDLPHYKRMIVTTLFPMAPYLQGV